jgi:hypothetical protein
MCRLGELLVLSVDDLFERIGRELRCPCDPG